MFCLTWPGRRGRLRVPGEPHARHGLLGAQLLRRVRQRGRHDARQREARLLVPNPPTRRAQKVLRVSRRRAVSARGALRRARRRADRPTARETRCGARGRSRRVRRRVNCVWRRLRGGCAALPSPLLSRSISLSPPLPPSFLPRPPRRALRPLVRRCDTMIDTSPSAIWRHERSLARSRSFRRSRALAERACRLSLALPRSPLCSPLGSPSASRPTRHTSLHLTAPFHDRAARPETAALAEPTRHRRLDTTRVRSERRARGPRRPRFGARRTH